MTRISVGIVTYRDDLKLKRLLASLAAQTEAPLEVIVMDAGADGATQALVEESESRLPVRYIRAAENNLGRNRSIIVDQARGDAVAFIDSDCWAFPDWLKELQENFAALKKVHPELAGIGGPSMPPPESNPFYKRLVDFFRFLQIFFISPQVLSEESLHGVDHLSTSNALFERDAILDGGNFSSRQKFVCEDLELGLRLRRAGKLLLYHPKPRVAHHTRTNLLAWSLRCFHISRGHVDLGFRYPELWKNRPLWEIVAGLLWGGVLAAPFLSVQAAWGGVAALVLAPILWLSGWGFGSNLILLAVTSLAVGIGSWSALIQKAIRR